MMNNGFKNAGFFFPETPGTIIGVFLGLINDQYSLIIEKGFAHHPL